MLFSLYDTLKVVYSNMEKVLIVKPIQLKMSYFKTPKLEFTVFMANWDKELKFGKVNKLEMHWIGPMYYSNQN